MFIIQRLAVFFTSLSLVSCSAIAANNGLYLSYPPWLELTRLDALEQIVLPSSFVGIEYSCYTDKTCGNSGGTESKKGITVIPGTPRCVQLEDNCMSSKFAGGLGGCAAKGFVNVAKTCTTGGVGAIGTGCRKTGFVKAWEISCP